MNRVKYAMWRFEMWTENHGSYDEIDYKVAGGELTPPPDVWEPNDLAKMRESFKRATEQPPKHPAV
jgi:hypothetical protein